MNDFIIYQGKDIDISSKAIEEWKRTHNLGEGWEMAFGDFLKGLPIVVLHSVVMNSESDSMPWCVQYAGNGHYFKTRDDALEYYESKIGPVVRKRQYMRKYREGHKEQIKESRRKKMITDAIKYLNEHPEEAERLRRKIALKQEEET